MVYFVGDRSRLRLADAKKDGTSRLTSHDQLYDLEISVKGTRCSLCERNRDDEQVVEVNLAAFMKSIDYCATAVYHTMLALFPAIASRNDVDKLRNSLRVLRYF